MRYIVSLMLVVVSIIHLLPLVGVLGNKHLETLYGLSFSEPNLSILMRHRAVLFGLLGSFLLLAAFQPRYQLLAFIAGFISVVSFLLLSWFVGDYNAKLTQVFRVDILALICLIIGAITYFYAQSND